MRFFKYEGLGNDFIVLEDLDGKAPKDSDFAIKWCDRRFGIGADGILYILRAEGADAYMKILNSDGSEAEMCGNGIRCVAKHLYDRGLVNSKEMTIDTMTGKKHIRCALRQGKVAQVSVDMGAPVLDCERIPMRCAGRFLEQEVEVAGMRVRGTAVSMGNPHFVTFQALKAEEVEALGPMLEKHPLFPKRTNVEFASLGRGGIQLRVYERGAAWTLACGTGACATVVAGVLSGRAKAGKDVEVRLPGGSLWINVDEGLSTVTMRGPATLVYEGTFQE
ncbi:MAG: diaminopimelate epimerase [Methanomassiliicoccales archaeon]|nr:diaminopimelate epimerase [Methanomassiliicoccales archaeon]